jgi:hypothetical protein
VRRWWQLRGDGEGGGNAERFADGAPGTRTTGGGGGGSSGGGGTPKLQLRVQRWRGSARRPGVRGPEARVGSG